MTRHQTKDINIFIEEIMDTSKFLKQIRSIIREEIEYALDKKLNENRRKDDREVLSHGINLVREATKVVKKPQPVQTKTKSKTGLSSIQALLEETRRSMEQSMNEEEYPEMRFTTDSLNSYSTNHIDATPAGVNPNDITPEVANALTRDYSALMAKINEKTGR